jgi:zinc-ribbon domain
MTIAIGLLMVLVVAAYVAAPFFTNAPAGLDGVPSVSASERQKLERQKLEAYSAIKELEFDYRMGKLSEADFTGIRNKYMAEALDAIKVLDTAKTAQTRERAENRRQARIAFCPACGRSVPQRAHFCPACGRQLKEEAVA